MLQRLYFANIEQIIAHMVRQVLGPAVEFHSRRVVVDARIPFGSNDWLYLRISYLGNFHKKFGTQNEKFRHFGSFSIFAEVHTLPYPWEKKVNPTLWDKSNTGVFIFKVRLLRIHLFFERICNIFISVRSFRLSTLMIEFF